MEVKVSELSGIALDWAVGTCRGLKMTNLNGQIVQYFIPPYSVDRTYSGTIVIDEENIVTSPLPGGMWRAYAPSGTQWIPCAGHDIEVFNWVFKQEGNTRTVAAMRCYVLSKMGEVVDVPEELL